ncbi:MAG: hypothetical protein KGL39_54455, partial [Patescibacteria group bacterium]|nr:hypothetical protein [Patescibacteria group bacterium]
MAKLYELTEEDRAAFGPWRDKWIANAMSTRPMDDADRARMVKAINGLYAAAKLPFPKRIIFVPSPFVLVYAAGFAAGIFYLRAATSDATSAATIDATRAATSDATRAATSDATSAATIAATSDATRAATSAATRAATSDATSAATIDATRAATSDAT